MNSSFTRRTLLGAGAAGLWSQEARAVPVTAPRRFEPYVTQPGGPVFLLEGSTLEDLWGLRRRLNPLVI